VSLLLVDEGLGTGTGIELGVGEGNLIDWLCPWAVVTMLLKVRGGCS
jgi:hypothetical protein